MVIQPMEIHTYINVEAGRSLILVCNSVDICFNNDQGPELQCFNAGDKGLLTQYLKSNIHKNI